VSRSRLTLGLALLALLLACPGCGGDKEAAKKPRTTTTRTTTTRTTTTHSETAPTRTETAAPLPVQTTPAPTRPAQDPATAPQTPGERDGSPRGTSQGGVDSPKNDTPPPKGSPAEQFEKDCDANPQSCG
jgi:hypothetical protein